MNLARLVRRLAYWARFHSAQEALREELEMHRELLAEDLRQRGLAPETARDDARRAIASVTAQRLRG